jgi:predicted ABC-type sugar transport system permease subunit
MTLMGVSYFWQLVIKGAVIIIAVLIDKYRTRHHTKNGLARSPTVTPIAFSSLADAKGEAASSAPAHTLMGVSYFWQLVIKGAVIIIAVLIDKYRTRHHQSA